MPRILLMVGALALTGCFGLMKSLQGGAPVKLQTKALGQAGPPVDVKSLQVMRADELPPGFFRANLPGGKVKLWAVPEWPTAADPHRVISAVGWTGGRYGQLPDEAKAAAAKVGANTLVKLTNRPVAYAVYVSSATASEAAPDAAKLLADEAGKHPDFKPSSAPSAVDAQALAPFVVEMKPNHCYKVAVALDPAAQWSPTARAFLSSNSTSSDALAGNRSGGLAEVFTTEDGVEMKAPYNGKLVRLRSFTSGLGCAAGNSTAQLIVTGKGRSKQVATGKLHFQVLSKKVSPAETALLIEKRKAAMAKAAADAAAFAAREKERAAKAAAERQRRDAQLAAQRQKRAASRKRSAPAASRHVSISISSDCRQTVRIFKGKKPKWGSGTYGRHSANSIVSYSGSAGDMIWIVDKSDNGISSLTLSPGMGNMKILRSCSGFGSR